MAETRKGRPPTRNTNPWKEEVGCEVKVCQAEQCDAERAEICALRKYWLERVQGLRELRGKVRDRALLREIEKQLRGLGEGE